MEYFPEMLLHEPNTAYIAWLVNILDSWISIFGYSRVDLDIFSDSIDDNLDNWLHNFAANF